MTHPPEKPAEPNPHARQGLVRSVVRFLGQNRIYWIAPAVIIIVLIGLLMLIAGSTVAPFTYPDS